MGRALLAGRGAAVHRRFRSPDVASLDRGSTRPNWCDTSAAADRGAHLLRSSSLR